MYSLYSFNGFVARSERALIWFILMQNTLDACLGALVWWLVGFSFAYGGPYEQDDRNVFIGGGTVRLFLLNALFWLWPAMWSFCKPDAWQHALCARFASANAFNHYKGKCQWSLWLWYVVSYRSKYTVGFWSSAVCEFLSFPQRRSPFAFMLASCTPVSRKIRLSRLNSQFVFISCSIQIQNFYWPVQPGGKYLRDNSRHMQLLDTFQLDKLSG